MAKLGVNVVVVYDIIHGVKGLKNNPVEEKLLVLRVGTLIKNLPESLKMIEIELNPVRIAFINFV